MGLQIIGADERMAEKRGIKALILGPAGVGKTSLLRTIAPERVLFLDFESGDLAVQDVEVDQVRPKTWQECRDLACILGGFNPVLPDTAIYSEAHFKAVSEKYGPALDKYDTFFIDSITVAARLCFKWCEQEPESFSDKTGAKNLLGTYGLLGREMLGWLTQLQHARSKNVIFVCLLDKVTDDFNRVHWTPQIEGSKIGRELPGIVDEVLTLQVLKSEDGTNYRAFVTSPENEWGFPAKDRSGRLDPIVEPNLTKLFELLNDSETQSAHAWQQDQTAPLAATN